MRLNPAVGLLALWTYAAAPIGAIAQAYDPPRRTMSANTSARESAMAGAGLLSDVDVGAASSSPAALSRLARAEAFLGHEFGLGDSSLQLLGFGAPYGRRSAVGGHVQVLKARHFVETDASGNPVRQWATSDLMMTVTFANRSQPWLSTGVNGKAFSTDLFGTRWMGVAFDAGMQAELPGGVRAAAALVNIGWQASSAGAAYRVPPEVALGLGATRAISSVSVHGQAELRRAPGGETRPQLLVGGELSFRKALFLRVGYRPGWRYGGVTTGIGFSSAQVGFDYAYLPLGPLGGLHKLGLSARFGRRRT